MVLLPTRFIGRLAARPAFPSLFTAPAARFPNIFFARAAAPLRQNGFESIRTLTGKREKVKVLLVLYDGKSHARDVSYYPALPFPSV